MKVALCFIISYEHILNKEDIWREWIEPNKDIINVYFYCKDFRKIKSDWIRRHSLPPNLISNTTYYQVIPAYTTLLKFALHNDADNQWFCMLTDSCCPIISPTTFKELFYKHCNRSFFSWKRAWWNPVFHKRGNLHKLPKQLWLANDPWFSLTRQHAMQTVRFIDSQHPITATICQGGIANESLFAIILFLHNELAKDNVICGSSHITDWSRLSSATSPHVFKEGNHQDITFINKELERNKCAMFIRKMSPEFPNEIIRHYIKN